MSIEFDPQKARSNLRKHGVSFGDAEQALYDPLALTIEDPDSDVEQRFITIGYGCPRQGTGGSFHLSGRYNPIDLGAQSEPHGTGAI